MKEIVFYAIKLFIQCAGSGRGSENHALDGDYSSSHRQNFGNEPRDFSEIFLNFPNSSYFQSRDLPKENL